MDNKDFNDNFYYEYTPKSLKNDDSSDRDLSSYSKPSQNTNRDISSRSVSQKSRTATAQKRNISSTSKPKTATKRTKKPQSKTNLYLKAGGKYAKGVINKYGEICMVSLGTIIKVIAFVVAFGIIILSLILAIMLFASKSGLSALSLVAIIAGTAIAAIFFFPIYGIGHIICQNNEILRIFTEESDE